MVAARKNIQETHNFAKSVGVSASAGLQVVTKESQKAQNIQNRILTLESQLPNVSDVETRQLIESHIRVLQTGQIPEAAFVSEDSDKGFDFKEFGITLDKSGRYTEAIVSSDISADFFKRLEYEVEAGRQEMPLLYQDIYQTTVNPNFPQLSDIKTLGPAGTTWELVPEGDSVEWATVTSSGKTIRQNHYGIGLAYTEEMFRFNQTWMFPELERDFGNSYNALLNHLHLNPIINASSFAGQTGNVASEYDIFYETLPLAEKYIWALKLAIANSMTDTTNPRYGPYVLLCHPLDAMTFAQALVTVPQQGTNVQMPNLAAANVKMTNIGMISAIIGYQGYVASKAKETTTYGGVSQGTAYLINVGQKRYDFINRTAQPFRRQNAGPIVERFILERVVWDTYFGIYQNVARAVEEITLPTVTSGEELA